MVSLRDRRHRLFAPPFTRARYDIRARQIDLIVVPFARLAVDLDVTARLLDEAVAWLSRGGTLPWLLGGEERIERLRCTSRDMPVPVSLTDI